MGNEEATNPMFDDKPFPILVDIKFVTFQEVESLLVKLERVEKREIGQSKIESIQADFEKIIAYTHGYLLS